MLYQLYLLLDFNLLQYSSVRAGIGFLIAFIFTMYLMPKYLTWAINKNANQPINKYVSTHDFKAKTPTMGGAIFILGTVIASLITVNLSNLYVIGGIFTLISFGFIGFKDDISKVLARDNLAGLSPKTKLFYQIIFGFIISLFLIISANFPTTFYIPFIKTPIFNLGYFSIPFWVFIFLATSNAVNLTDGLDGLATVPSIIAFATLGLIIYVTGHAVFSQYLLIENIKGVGEVTIIIASLIGSLLAFLWYNCYPAEVFMGDTGSLSLGGFLAYLSIIGKSEILLILIGIIFVIETVSVILQVGSYKIRKERIFLMAPIHHHFELKKWAENKIIVRFWMISFIANILALISFKIR
jgi:phospho-N-acetylmuramoyl-pentapeptide-transferase